MIITYHTGILIILHNFMEWSVAMYRCMSWV